MSLPDLNRVHVGDALAILRAWPDSFVHCVVTSIPYWNLRDYGVDGQMGLEATPWQYIQRMEELFREVRRVLRPEGNCWINVGDSYYSGINAGDPTTRGSRTQRLPNGHGNRTGRKASGTTTQPTRVPIQGLRPKNLLMMPARLAIALQDDGWILRCDCVWSKKNCMPESVTDRPSRSHEYVFLLAKNERYFYDMEAVREDVADSSIARVSQNDGHPNWNTDRQRDYVGSAQTMDISKMVPIGGRNKRSVWNIATKPFKGSHFAVMPPELAKICILAGTSEKGVCADCGAPWERIVEREFIPQQDVSRERGLRAVDGTKPMDASNRWSGSARGTTASSTLGWQPTCECHGKIETEKWMEDEDDPETGEMVPTEQSREVYRPAIPLEQHPIKPAIVLDPFGGAGTTGLVAAELNRNFLLTELNPEYAAMAAARIAPEIAQGKLL